MIQQPEYDNYLNHSCPYHNPGLIDHKAISRAIPPCNYFFKAASGDPVFHDDDKLQLVLDACVTGDLETVKNTIEQRKATNKPVPLQIMTLAATERGHAQIVDLCFESGAHLDTSIESAAAIFPSGDLYRVLMGKGGWPKLQRLDGILSMDIGKGYEVVKFLLDQGAKMPPGALMKAAASGDIDTAALLLRHGEKSKGSGALQAATERGQLPMIEFLLDSGEDVDDMPPLGQGYSDPRDCRNGTALHIAVEMGHLPIIQLLLHRGADVRSRDERGRTAIDIAQSEGGQSSDEIVAMIQKAYKERSRT